MINNYFTTEEVSEMQAVQNAYLKKRVRNVFIGGIVIGLSVGSIVTFVIFGNCIINALGY